MGKCIADYERKLTERLRKINGLAWILLVVFMTGLFVEGTLVSIGNGGRIINIGLMSVAVAICLVFCSVAVLPQAKGIKSLRNLSTVVYCLHPWLIFIVGLLEHFEIVVNAGIKAVLVLAISIAVSWFIVKLSGKYKILKILI